MDARLEERVGDAQRPPRGSTPSTPSQCSGAIRASVLSRVMPALWTTTSTPPQRPHRVRDLRRRRGVGDVGEQRRAADLSRELASGRRRRGDRGRTTCAPSSGEQARRRLADAARGAGDERDLASSSGRIERDVGGRAGARRDRDRLAGDERGAAERTKRSTRAEPLLGAARRRGRGSPSSPSARSLWRGSRTNPSSAACAAASSGSGAVERAGDHHGPGAGLEPSEERLEEVVERRSDDTSSEPGGVEDERVDARDLAQRVERGDAALGLAGGAAWWGRRCRPAPRATGATPGGGTRHAAARGRRGRARRPPARGRPRSRPRHSAAAPLPTTVMRPESARSCHGPPSRRRRTGSGIGRPRPPRSRRAAGFSNRLLIAWSSVSKRPSRYASPPGASPTQRPPPALVYTETRAGSTSGLVKRTSIERRRRGSPARGPRFSASTALASVAKPWRMVDRNPASRAYGRTQWMGLKSPVSLRERQTRAGRRRRAPRSRRGLRRHHRARLRGSPSRLPCPPSGMCTRISALIASGALRRPGHEALRRSSARRPSSSTISRRARTRSGSPAGERRVNVDPAAGVHRRARRGRGARRGSAPRAERPTAGNMWAGTLPRGTTRDRRPTWRCSRGPERRIAAAARPRSTGRGCVGGARRIPPRDRSAESATRPRARSIGPWARAWRSGSMGSLCRFGHAGARGAVRGGAVACEPGEQPLAGGRDLVVEGAARAARRARASARGRRAARGAPCACSRSISAIASSARSRVSRSAWSIASAKSRFGIPAPR